MTRIRVLLASRLLDLLFAAAARAPPRRRDSHHLDLLTDQYAAAG